MRTTNSGVLADRGGDCFVIVVGKLIGSPSRKPLLQESLWSMLDNVI